MLLVQQILHFLFQKSKIYETSPMFFITNTDAVINLENTKLNYGSNQLVTVSGNDGEWGVKEAMVVI